MEPTSSSSEPRPLVCPSCATAHALDERFCPVCGMPLTYAGVREEPVTARRERARKIKPQLAEGPLVKVAGARHQAEAEFLQGLLLEEGVPSTTRRARGFDVPDFLAAGPREILVPASGADAARDTLRAPGEEGPPRDIWLGRDLAAGAPEPGAPAWVRALAVTLAVLILALIAAGVYEAIFP
jgi:hypothetical protein